MSRRHDVQDPSGRITYYPGRGTLHAWGASPAGSIQGFAPGCIWHDLTNGIVYVNVGTFASSTWTDLSTAGTLLVGLLSTAAEVNRTSDVSTRIVTLTAATPLTLAAHSDKIILLGEVGGDAALAVTLPAATGSGARFKMFVSVVNTSGYTIATSPTTDVFQGQIVTASTADTPDLAQPWVTASNSNLITLSGTDKGGVSIGDWIEVVDILSGKWAVYGATTSSGTELTPFSNV